MDTTPAPAPVPEAQKPKTSYGTVAGLLIIVAAIVIGALYFLKERVQSPETASPTDPSAIEADLDAQSSDEFEREIDEAFVELDAAIEAQ